MKDETIEKCLGVIQHADFSLYKHCVKTAEIAKEMGYELGTDFETLYEAGLVHDIGKLAIPKSILVKTDTLSKVDRSVINLHPFNGYCLLQNFGVDEKICEIVLFHHGFDKPFYNLELVYDDDVIYLSKILRCADCFAALTSERVYRPKTKIEKTISIMKNDDDLDQEMVSVLEKLYYRKEGE